MTEQVASYIYDKNVSYGIYNVFACYDSLEDYDIRKVSFYDVWRAAWYDSPPLCVNEGEPFYDFPSWQEIFDNYYMPSITEAEKDSVRDLKWITKE